MTTWPSTHWCLKQFDYSSHEWVQYGVKLTGNTLFPDVSSNPVQLQPCENTMQLHFLCRYCKRTDIYYSTWSFENVAKICQLKFLDPPPHTLKNFQGGYKKDFRPPPLQHFWMAHNPCPIFFSKWSAFKYLPGNINLFLVRWTVAEKIHYFCLVCK